MHNAENYQWSGQDCVRESCETKTATGKLLSQDCTRRNLVYETYCMTCEERDTKRLEGEENEKGEQDKNNKNSKDNIKENTLPKLYKYLGELCRSVWERAAEHLADLKNLSPQATC